MPQVDHALAEQISRAVEAVPGVVEVYPTVAARISRGILGAVENVAAGLQGRDATSPLDPPRVALSGDGADQKVDVHIGTDATVATPTVARAVYDVVAALVHPQASIEIQVSRIEWPAPPSIGSPKLAASVDVAESVAASVRTVAEPPGRGQILGAAATPSGPES